MSGNLLFEGASGSGPIDWATLALPLAAWIATWGAVGTGFVLLVRTGRDYVNGWKVTSVYFTLALLGAFWAFSESLRPVLAALEPVHLAWILGGTLSQLAAHILAHRFGRRPERRIREAPHVYWLQMDGRYTVSKTFEILFQQTMLIALVRLLHDAGLSTREVILIAVPVFGLVHLPIAKLVGRYFGTYYFLSSLLAAVFMPALILWRPDGFVYSYVIHVLYYVGSQMLFWDWSRESGTLRFVQKGPR